MEPGYIFYRLGQDISVCLPRRLVYWIACFLADLRFYFSSVDRAAIIKNLEITTNCNDTLHLKRLAKQSFRNFAKNLADFFRFGLIDNRFVMRNVKVVGLEYVDSALRYGKGVIVTTAHMGNWELGAVVMAQKGYALNAVVWEHKDQRISDLFINQRERKRIKVISLGIALRRCFKVLANNELLAMVGDRDFSEQGTKVRAKFFGRDVWVPRGPAALSLRTHAVIVPGFTIREKDDSFILYFDKPIEYEPAGRIGEDISLLTQKILDAIKIYVEKYPEQWFVFGDFWETNMCRHMPSRIETVDNRR